MLGTKVPAIGVGGLTFQEQCNEATGVSPFLQIISVEVRAPSSFSRIDVRGRHNGSVGGSGASKSSPSQRHAGALDSQWSTDALGASERQRSGKDDA
jgi:hypothetical protein